MSLVMINFFLKYIMNIADLGRVVIEGVVDGTECWGGCWAAGVVILEGGRTVALTVLQTLGWDVNNQGGLGRDVVVVVDAVNLIENYYLIKNNENTKIHPIDRLYSSFFFIHKNKIMENIIKI